MTFSDSKIKQCFEQASNTYDQHSKVQQAVGLALIAQLKNFKGGEVLDLGCGTGVTTNTLCSTIKLSGITLSDISQALVQKTAEKIASYSPISWPMDFDSDWHNLPMFDLIFSNMAMQWSVNIAILIERCFTHLHKGGYLAFSIPLDGTFAQLRAIGVNVNHFYSPEDIEKNLLSCSFCIRSINIIEYLEPYKTMFEALHNIKKVGANCTLKAHNTLILNRKILLNPGVLNYKIGFFVVQRVHK